MFGGAIWSGLIGLAIFGYARSAAACERAVESARGVLCGYSADGMNAMAWFLRRARGLAGIFAAPSGVSPELAISMITAGFVAAVIGRLRLAARCLARRAHSRVAETLTAGYVSVR